MSSFADKTMDVVVVVASVFGLVVLIVGMVVVVVGLWSRVL